MYPLRSTHSIAPYKSRGLEKAAELSIRWDVSDKSVLTSKGSQTESCLRSDSDLHAAGMCTTVFFFFLAPSIQLLLLMLLQIVMFYAMFMLHLQSKKNYLWSIQGGMGGRKHKMHNRWPMRFEPQVFTTIKWTSNH